MQNMQKSGGDARSNSPSHCDEMVAVAVVAVVLVMCVQNLELRFSMQWASITLPQRKLQYATWSTEYRESDGRST